MDSMFLTYAFLITVLIAVCGFVFGFFGEKHRFRPGRRGPAGRPRWGGPAAWRRWVGGLQARPASTRRRMKEFENVRQDPGGFKRLFSNGEFLLYVWYTDYRGREVGFQLLYDENERAITYDEAGKLHHNRINDRGWYSAPVLEGDAGPVRAELVAAFRHASADLPADVVRYVIPVLENAVAKRPGSKMPE